MVNEKYSGTVYFCGAKSEDEIVITDFHLDPDGNILLTTEFIGPENKYRKGRVKGGIDYKNGKFVSDVFEPYSEIDAEVSLCFARAPYVHLTEGAIYLRGTWRENKKPYDRKVHGVLYRVDTQKATAPFFDWD